MYESLRSTVEKCVCVCVTILTKPNRHKFEERNDAGSRWVIKLGASRKAARIKQNNLQINPKHVRLQLTMTIVLDQCQLYIYIHSLYLSLSIYIYIYVHTILILSIQHIPPCFHSFPFSKNAVAHPPSLSATPQTPFGRIGASEKDPGSHGRRHWK